MRRSVECDPNDVEDDQDNNDVDEDDDDDVGTYIIFSS